MAAGIEEHEECRFLRIPFLKQAGYGGRYEPPIVCLISACVAGEIAGVIRIAADGILRVFQNVLLSMDARSGSHDNEKLWKELHFTLRYGYIPSGSK